MNIHFYELKGCEVLSKYSIFDVIGPIMVGPSSSHTAGAAKMAKVARILCDEEIKSVKFLLHGSFAQTYKGHGTDRALIAGILGFEPDDERLKEAFTYAKESNLDYEFIETSLGDVHPNTVKFEITTISGNKKEVIGSSIGGGNIEILNIDGNEIELSLDKTNIITSHKDVPGVIFEITKLISSENINIANMKVVQKEKGQKANMFIEIEASLTADFVKKLNQIDAIENIMVVNPI